MPSARLSTRSTSTSNRRICPSRRTTSSPPRTRSSMSGSTAPSCPSSRQSTSVPARCAARRGVNGPFISTTRPTRRARTPTSMWQAASRRPIRSSLSGPPSTACSSRASLAPSSVTRCRTLPSSTPTRCGAGRRQSPSTATRHARPSSTPTVSSPSSTWGRPARTTLARARSRPRRPIRGMRPFGLSERTCGTSAGPTTTQSSSR